MKRQAELPGFLHWALSRRIISRDTSWDANILPRSDPPIPVRIFNARWRAATRKLKPSLLLELALGFWVILLIALPVLVLRHLPLSVLSQIQIEVHGHQLIESFCGFVAMVIAGMLLSLSLKRRDLSILLFGLGFLGMGAFDILHALSDPLHDTATFVLYHTISSLVGGVFILAGILTRMAGERSEGLSRADLTTALSGVVLVVAIAALYRLYIPRLIPEGAGYFSFSSATHLLHYLAGLSYALAAVAFYRYFRQHRQVLILVVASLLVLFAQSAYLFSFSTMWDMAWWMWHGAKVVFYLGIMVTVSVSYLVALHTIDKSRRHLARANQRLQRSQAAIRLVNEELKIRNRMAQEAMTSLNLDNALDAVFKALHRLLGCSGCELILRIPEDEVDEFDCRGARLSSRWPVHAHTASVACGGGVCDPEKGCGNRATHCGSQIAPEAASVCLALAANGQEIGHLRLLVDDPEQAGHSMDQLQALAGEAGTIIHNALLNHHWLEANEFRSALLRVSVLLTSTLDLGRVLESVCSESAALLESDGALVWLPDKETADFTLVAKWFADNEARNLTELAEWCRDGKLCSRLLQNIQGLHRPRAILWQTDEPSVPLVRPPDCPWQALALFPLVDGDSLIGVMVMVRKQQVRYSAATLAKGELLAGQVRIAINNARSYERLAEANLQLKLAEEQKIHSERMAVLGQMAASVAHEVRNPLSAIANCLAVLRTENSSHQAALSIIDGEVERLTTLTSNFLTFGKPNASRRRLVFLEGVLGKVCAALERHVQEEGLAIQVETRVSGKLHPIMFDPDGLETVLWNLLLNAAQSIHGSGRILVTLRQRDHRFLLAVSDTGKGIPAEIRGRIFEPFYSQRSHGAGLGLAIVQRFVQEWGGRIRVRTEPGKGTHFLLWLPEPESESLGGQALVHAV